MLEKLKEYKELIAIVVFFLGGFLWLQDQYPNKKYLRAELDSVQCRLDRYMKLTQLQIRSQEQEKQVGELSRKLSEAPSAGKSQNGVPISPAMRVELEQLTFDYTTTRSQLGQTTTEMAKVRDELERGICVRADL